MRSGVARRDRHLRALRHQAGGDAGADPLRAARDERDAAREPEVHQPVAAGAARRRRAVRTRARRAARRAARRPSGRPETTPIRLASPASAAPPSAGSSGSRSAVAAIAAHAAHTAGPAAQPQSSKNERGSASGQHDGETASDPPWISAARRATERSTRPLWQRVPHAAALYASRRGRLAQLVRAPALQAGGPRFEPGTAHHSNRSSHARTSPWVTLPPQTTNPSDMRRRPRVR